MSLKTSRQLDIAINSFLNNWLPPVLRDQTWLMKILLWLACGKKAPVFLDFRNRVYDMSEQEFANIYAELNDGFLDRPTDLNEACIQAILSDVVGKDILEVGCGRGFLAEKLAPLGHVTASDIALPGYLKSQKTEITFIECPSYQLPFSDKSFDTVICTHTLEHVRELEATIAELQRVCRQRLIIVLPCERPYRHSFNLHIHFFPYASCVYGRFGKTTKTTLKKLSGDWYYKKNF